MIWYVETYRFDIDASSEEGFLGEVLFVSKYLIIPIINDIPPFGDVNPVPVWWKQIRFWKGVVVFSTLYCMFIYAVYAVKAYFAATGKRRKWAKRGSNHDP